VTSEPVPARGVGLLRLYPRAWRSRYESEVRALLESRTIGTSGRIDLVRGALDAHLHPERLSPIPPLASVSGGALWTSAAVILALQPVQPDWPGYLIDLLPLMLLGTACLVVAVIGVWLRLGDRVGRFDRLAIVVAIGGHLAWAVALIAAMIQLDYGPATAVTSTLAAAGEILVAFALVRAGQSALGGLLATAGVALVVPAGWSWLVFGLAWSAIGLVQWQAWGRSSMPGSGLA
jgi:hypothetical protein